MTTSPKLPLWFLVTRHWTSLAGVALIATASLSLLFVAPQEVRGHASNPPEASVATRRAETRLRTCEARRAAEKWIESYDEGRILKKEYDDRMDAVATAVCEIEATIPAALPLAADNRALIAGLLRVLARLGSKPFGKQRAVLTCVVRSIRVVDGQATEVRAFRRVSGGSRLR